MRRLGWCQLDEGNGMKGLRERERADGGTSEDEEKERGGCVYVYVCSRIILKNC